MEDGGWRMEDGGFGGGRVRWRGYKVGSIGTGEVGFENGGLDLKKVKKMAVTERPFGFFFPGQSDFFFLLAKGRGPGKNLSVILLEAWPLRIFSKKDTHTYPHLPPTPPLFHPHPLSTHPTFTPHPISQLHLTSIPSHAILSKRNQRDLLLGKNNKMTISGLCE